VPLNVDVFHCSRGTEADACVCVNTVTNTVSEVRGQALIHTHTHTADQ